jgi:hypothetical protein
MAFSPGTRDLHIDESRHNAPSPPRKSGGRLIELDILRGFLLLWMTFTHLPTFANVISNQTFGFVSGAEGFIFLAAFMVGQLQHRIEKRSGELGSLRDLARRTLRIYIYHCGLLVVAFTLVAAVGVNFHRLALQNLLSYYLQDPKHAIPAAALLEYRPSLLDILPMYIFFMIFTPLARKIAHRWSWDPVIYISFAIWVAAQCGIRAWVYRHVNLFGLNVPESSTGAFNLFAWQLLWMVGLALGSLYADALYESSQNEGDPRDQAGFPHWLLRLSWCVAVVFLVLRYCPVDRWVNPDIYGWLIDKWHLGPVRVINFAALTILLVRFGGRIAALPFMKPLASLGQASLEVFSVHVLCCLGGDALSHDADPHLPWWQQILLLIVTLSALFFTAHLGKIKNDRRRAQKAAAVAR